MTPGGADDPVSACTVSPHHKGGVSIVGDVHLGIGSRHVGADLLKWTPTAVVEPPGLKDRCGAHLEFPHSDGRRT